MPSVNQDQEAERYIRVRKAMTEHVGTLLWKIRADANLSLGKLAQQSGISKATLSRWEAGLRQPRITELEAVLDALMASPAQRSLVLSQIDAPRALRQIRQSPATDSLGAPLTAGDLLRAMRLRGGWTQEQVSQRLGVVRETLSRWESGERLPATEQMQALCYTLEAREEEIIALTTGHFRETPATVDRADWREKAAELYERMDAINENRVGGLDELHYIQLDREVWAWALREPEARLLLGYVRIFHAQHHRVHQRWELCRTLTQQAEEALQSAPAPPEETLDHPLPRLAILQAAVVGRGGIRPAPDRGIHLLSPWMRRHDVPHAHRAWILSDLSTYSAQVGNHSDALLLAERACQVAQSSHPNELLLRRCDHSRLLLQLGKPEEALGALSDIPDTAMGRDEVDALLLRVEALEQTGNLHQAQDELGRANALIEVRGWETQRQKALALAQRF